MVMIGAFAERTGIVPLAKFTEGVKEIFAAKGSKVYEINTLAIEEGASFIRKNYGASST